MKMSYYPFSHLFSIISVWRVCNHDFLFVSSIVADEEVFPGRRFFRKNTCSYIETKIP